MSAINRSLLASAAASVASTTSVTSATSAKSRKGALSSPESVSLDAYVRRAWSSLNNDVVSVAPEAFTFAHRADKNTDTEAGGEAITEAAFKSDGKENINADSNVDKGALPNAIAALFERYVPKAPDLKSPVVDAERPIKHKERNAAAADLAAEGAQILPLPLMPLQALIPPCPENIKMGLQVGKGFSKASSIGVSAEPPADTPARTRRAGLGDIPQFSNSVKPISKKSPPVEAASAAVAVQIPKSDKADKADAKPISPDTDAVYGDVALSTDAPRKPTQTPAEKSTQTSIPSETQRSAQTSTQAKVSTPIPTQRQTTIQTSIQTPIPAPRPAPTPAPAPTPTPTPTLMPMPTLQLAAHSTEMPRKEKSLPRIAPDAPAQPLPLIQAMQEQAIAATPNSAAPSQDRARHSPQPGQAPATAPTPSTDAPLSATTGSTLTYRFDKWNGNHAVTVHAPLHVDSRSRELEPAGRNTASPTVQNAEKIAVQDSARPNLQSDSQSNPQYKAQYSLSPSDELVSQRLGEHLARTADRQDAPSMRLTDSDERQRRQEQGQRQGQGQAQQEDDEDEA